MNLENRKYVIIAFILFIASVYAFRLFYMQVIDDTWVLRAQEIAEKRKEVVPPRGIILDRNGKKVVSNKTYYNLMMVEEKFGRLDTIAFAKLINWSPLEVRKRFEEIKEKEGYYVNKRTNKKTSNYQKSRAYPFLKELSLDEITKIALKLDEFPGFYEEVASMRNYPFSNSANILGYLNEATREEIDLDRYYKPGSNLGRSGIERYYEKELRGRKGIKYVVTSATNNALESYANGKYDTTAQQGQSLTLGLDVLLQEYGEKLMQNKRGCIVAIEPSTGEILCLVSSPSYDPNLLVGRKSISLNYPQLLKMEGLPLFPRPLQSEYPPGSIFKLVQSLIGLQEGVIQNNSSFVCNKGLVGCHNHPTAQSVSEAVQYSCNPYFYAVTKKIIQQQKSKNINADAEIGLNLWHKYMASFGLGIKLGTDISGERPGLIPNSIYYDKWYGKNNWSFSTISSNSIGQGEVKLTPLQMANIAVIIANKGWYYAPHFVKSIGGKGPHKKFTVKNITMVEQKNFDAVVEGMRRVVNEAGGTGKLARLADIVVCGKTGTVQNPHGEDHSCFIAFAPMINPKISVAVFVENAGAGGTWAAPIASLIIEKYLKQTVNLEREKSILEKQINYVKGP